MEGSPEWQVEVDQYMMSSKSVEAKQLVDEIFTAYKAGTAQASSHYVLGDNTATVY